MRNGCYAAIKDNSVLKESIANTEAHIFTAQKASFHGYSTTQLKKEKSNTTSFTSQHELQSPKAMEMEL